VRGQLQVVGIVRLQPMVALVGHPSPFLVTLRLIMHNAVVPGGPWQWLLGSTDFLVVTGV